MGTMWKITVWDEISDAEFDRIKSEVLALSEAFEATYSRFKKTSLIWELTEKRGAVAVPNDLVRMLRLYEKLNIASGGKCNPLIGFALSDLGYDIDYSLKPKEVIRNVPRFHDALRIIDDTHIELQDSVLIDLGALGKGFFVDRLASYLKGEGSKRFLVDGSGDIYYEGNGKEIRCGLEDPKDTTKVIGVLTLNQGAFCASAGSRRAWGEYQHTIDPDTLRSPSKVLATWVQADSAVVADGLATCLFLTEPTLYEENFHFEYCTLSDLYHIKNSPGWTGEFFF